MASNRDVAHNWAHQTGKKHRGHNMYYLAFGPLQIRQCVLTDVNRKFHTKFNLTEMLDKETSEIVFSPYMKIYATPERLGHDPTPEDMARIWQAGPSGICRMDFGGWSICIRDDKTTIGCQTQDNKDWLKWTLRSRRSYPCTQTLARGGKYMGQR